MKKTLSIILSLILALGVIVGIGVSAYAEESEVFTLPDVTLNEETYLTLEDMGISDFVSQIREHFPPTIEPKYENGVLSIPNVQAATATYYSFTDYNDYEMTLVDGYWTLEIEESIYNDGFGLIRYYGTDEEWQAIYRQGVMECIMIACSQDRVVQIYPTFTTFFYMDSDDLIITNEYDIDGALTMNSVRFDSNGFAVVSYYNSSKELEYAEILVNGSFYYYLSNQGWSSNHRKYQPIDPPQGWEEADDKDFMSIAPCSIPCAHTELIDEIEAVCPDCGTEFFSLNGVRYEVVGDITNTGLNVNWYGTQSVTKVCYKAGDGYVVVEHGEYDAKIILYNATIDVRGLEKIAAIYTNIGNTEYTIYGINNIYGDSSYAIRSFGSSSDESEVVINGVDGGILNVYGSYSGNYLTLNSGTMNVYHTNDTNNYIIAIDLEKELVINEGATLNAIASGSTYGFNVGILALYGIKNNGTLNATYLTGIDNDNEMIYNLVVSGDVVLYNDLYNLFKDEEIPEGMTVEFNFIVPEGTSVTVSEGVTLDLDSMTRVDVQGKIIVEGTLICTHKGGEATCTEDAICEVCKLPYIEAFGHEYDSTVTDPDCENGGYTTYTCTVCGDTYNDNEVEALGHDFEKGECTVCGEEDPDLNWVVKLIYAIINFFKKLFGFI